MFLGEGDNIIIMSVRNNDTRTYQVEVPYYEYTDINGTGGDKTFIMSFRKIEKARQFKRIMSYVVNNWGNNKIGSFIVNWAIELLENNAMPGNYYTSGSVIIREIKIIN